MPNRESIREQVADDQMGCENNVGVLPTNSAIGATVDENRLSSEFQHGQSYKYQRSSTRSSSTNTWYSTLDDTASNEVIKKATFFVKTFVEKFENKVFECSEEAKPGSKTQKTGKISTYVNSIVNNSVPPGLLRVGLCKMNEHMDFFVAKAHRKGAKKVSAAFVPLEDQIREVLVEASLEIFQKFEKQLIGIVDVDPLSWKRGIEKLAIDAVSRVINYISASNEKGEFPVSRITKGIILGKSKKKLSLSKCFGYRVKDKQGDEIWITSELYEKVGIKKIEGSTTDYYQLKEHEKYGYRLPFTWELEEWCKVSEKYMPADPPKEEYVYILDEEKKKKLVSNILKEIHGNDPVRKKDIEKLNEKIEKLHVYSEDKDKNTFSFNFGHLPEFFIKREEVLNELEKKLSSKNQEVEMSRMILIHGKYGTGKSELARSYAYSKESDSNIWTKVVWINAETCDTLSSSFRDLAERLKISIKNVVDHRDREIESIVKDVYEKFRDVKSLFIFDNASGYKKIEKFLPSHFSDLFFGGKKPYVLITSRNKNWKEGIEKIELDDGFSLGEAIIFIERTLEIKGRSQDHSLVKLTEALNYLPLALAQATSYIKREKLSISKYLEHYNKAMQESDCDYFIKQGITKELFTTLKVNFNKIKGEKNIGQQSHDILAFMAYLSPNQIDIEEIFLRKKSEEGKQLALDAFDLLNKFSVIELEKSVAKVHRVVQKTIRVEEERAGTEEETLREIMTSFCLTNINHITSVWSHISKYSKLVNEFTDSIYDESSTILHLLAKDGNEEVIKRILEKIDPNKLNNIINAVNEEELTALDYAAMYGYLCIVKYLVEKGADVNLQNEDGMSSLHFAAENGHLDIMKYLVEKGADVNLQDECGINPLHYAAKNGHLNIVKYLVERGTSINLQNGDYMSSLHYAAKSGHLDIMKYLVEKGADVNLQDECGMSPLHYAAKSGHLDIMKYLVEKGVDVNLQDECGINPLHYAAKNGHLDIIKYLVEKGADINLCDKYGMSPLHYADENDYLNITEYLRVQKANVNPVHEQSQVLMRKRSRTSELQDCTLSCLVEDQCTSIKRRNLEIPLDSKEITSLTLDKLTELNHKVNYQIQRFTQQPISSLNSIIVEPANNKSLKRVTYAGQVA